MIQAELRKLHLDILRGCKASASDVWDDGYRCGVDNRPTATWVQDPNNPLSIVCSNCGARPKVYPVGYHYCPNCGAKLPLYNPLRKNEE